MFEKDQLIMCGGHGVCRVVSITDNPVDRRDKVRKYYVLEPLFEKASTIYTGYGDRYRLDSRRKEPGADV